MSEYQSDYTRRKFIKHGAAGLAAAGLTAVTPAIARADESQENETTSSPVIRTLGRTGLKMPIISMGVGAANSPELVAACWEAGMRHFDTAAVYQYGRNEQMVGQAIKKLGVRDKAIIATKIHTTDQREKATPETLGRKLNKELNACLKRLGTDYVDILYVHAVDDSDVPSDEALKVEMVKLRESGKTRSIGISTHTNMANVINTTVDAKVWDVILTAVNFTMANDTALLGAIKKAADAGVGVVAMKTQAGGANFPNPDTQRNYSGQTINRAALKWVMANENICTAITGISNFDHMRENMLVAGSLALADDENKFLNDNAITLGFGFCRGCSSCLPSCPLNADIPTLMRTSMYATQYADIAKARQVLDKIPAGRGFSECISCSECVAQCAYSVDIPNRIEELQLLHA